MKKIFLIPLSLIVLGLALVVMGLRNSPQSPAVISQEESRKFETSQSAVLGVRGEEVLTTKVVDGDTIEIEGRAKVRYIGIDTPETVDPHRPMGCFGKEASSENKRLVEGRRVYLLKDISETDKFGRLLRYVYLKQDDGTTVFVNDYLVRQGFAKVATYPPDVKFSEQFLQAEREARSSMRGLWGRC